VTRSMRWGLPRVMGLVAAVALLGAPSAALSAQPPAPLVTDTFPHIAHQGLFPLCSGCHVGIAEGEIETAYPDPSSCSGCHNGVDRGRVTWSPEPLPTGLLDFSHPGHAAAVADAPGASAPLDCAGCHVAEGGPRMEVVPVAAAGCLSCHGVEPEQHLVGGTDCTSCHRAAAESSTGADLLARVAQVGIGLDEGETGAAHASLLPSDHLVGDFLATHAPSRTEAETRCATCHVQERCAGCHVDAGLSAIQSMDRAPREWTLPIMRADYPTPESHLNAGFELTHALPTPAVTDCSTCHTRNDCATCHIEPVPAVVDSLPRRPAAAAHLSPAAHPSPGAILASASPTRISAGPGPLPDTIYRVRAPGVGLVMSSPTSHASPFFMTAHPLLSSGSPDSCAGCHEQSFCTSCHEQPGETGFHPGGFVLRHAPAASSAFQDCSSCHSTERFCRECHTEVGMGSTGRLGGGFHDAEPIFLLRHGTAARRDLESCASCHTQNDCRQCHSQTGAFRISPHGPDFNASRAQQANPWICSACHIGPIGGPIGGGAP